MPWQAIQYVSSGLTLVAFVIAVIAWVLKSRSETKERLIQLAKENERADLVRDALEFFRVDTSGLTKAQQYQLALEQIRARAQRFKIVAGIVCIFALSGAVVAAYAISRPQQVGPAGTSPLSLTASLWNVELDTKGALRATKEFPGTSAGIPTASLAAVVDWVSRELGLPANQSAPNVRLKVDIPADLKREKPTIVRVPDGPMDVLLWNITPSGKIRIPWSPDVIGTLQERFILEVRVPGYGAQAIEVVPGQAVTKETELTPAPVRIGIETFSGRGEGIAERLYEQLGTNKRIHVVSPDMLESIREEVQRHNEEIRRRPYIQLPLRSLGVDYILSGAVHAKEQ